MEKTKPEVLKVSSTTNVGKLAGSLKKRNETDPDVKLVVRFVGAGAANQALKAIILFNQMLAKEGSVCHILPAFGPSDGTLTVLEFNLKIEKV